MVRGAHGRLLVEPGRDALELLRERVAVRGHRAQGRAVSRTVEKDQLNGGGYPVCEQMKIFTWRRPITAVTAAFQ